MNTAPLRLPRSLRRPAQPALDDRLVFWKAIGFLGLFHRRLQEGRTIGMSARISRLAKIIRDLPAMADDRRAAADLIVRYNRWAYHDWTALLEERLRALAERHRRRIGSTQ